MSAFRETGFECKLCGVPVGDLDEAPPVSTRWPGWVQFLLKALGHVVERRCKRCGRVTYDVIDLHG